jgi:hypothetical protein
VNDPERESAAPHGAVEAVGADIAPEEILVVRRGPGANCSSVGSVLDILFVSAAVGGAILVGVTAALARAEPRDGSRAPEPDPEEKSDDAREG